jgi:uncharacterized membrane protein
MDQLKLLVSGEGIYMILRWFHFLAGITWIGILYYFNLLQTPFFAGADGAVKSAMIRGLVPKALWWFRWGAMFTFLTGLVILFGTKHRQGLPWESAYMTLIGSGAVLGTIMWANVWFVIWPAQRVVIASAEQVAGGGQPIGTAAALGARAGMASRTNVVLSMPMLFLMGSASHLPTLVGRGSPLLYWLVFAAVVAQIEVNALAKPGKPTQKMLTTVSGAIHAGLLLTAVVVVAICMLTA